MRIAISAAIIEDKNILIVRKKDTWILPGGKPELDESDVNCLIREFSEELPYLKIYNFEYFNSFTGTTPYKNDELCAKIYFAETFGKITPSAEISEAIFTKDPEKYNLSDITKKAIIALKEMGYI